MKACGKPTNRDQIWWSLKMTFARMFGHVRVEVPAVQFAFRCDEIGVTVNGLTKLDRHFFRAHQQGFFMTQTIYEAAGGRQAILDLAHAWHARCLADPIVSHAFSHGFHPEHSERLAAYWAEALGGPPDYSQSIGDETFVVRIHAGNGEHQEMDDRAEACFAMALDDAGLPNDARLRSALKDYFHWATGTMSAYPKSPEDVPKGLAFAHWSWNGPE